MNGKRLGSAATYFLNKGKGGKAPSAPGGNVLGRGRWPGLLVRGANELLELRERHPFLLAVVLGVVLGALHLALTLLLTPAADFWGRYALLGGSEAGWFENIVNRGYVSTVPAAPSESMDSSNVAFFPGYPFLASGVMQGFDLEARKALFWASQLGLTLFWTYFVGFLLRWRTPVLPALLAVGAIMAHPAAAYLVAGGDALFLAALLGTLYWSTQKGGGAACLAVVHGVGLTAVRLLGVPVLLAGLITAKAGKRRGWGQAVGNLERQAMTAMVGLLGAAFFFGFCQARFGQWDLYLQTAYPGWREAATYLAPLQWDLYFPTSWSALREAAHSSTGALYSVPWMFGGTLLLEGWLFISVYLLKAGNTTRLRMRLPLYLSAIAILYFGAAQMVALGDDGGLRTQLFAFTLWVLALWQAFSLVPTRTAWVRAVILSVVGLFVALAWGAQWIYSAAL